MQKIFPFLWFDSQAEDAANFYSSVFKNSKLKAVSNYPDSMPDMAGKVMMVEFNLAGIGFLAMNAGPHFKFTPAISFFVNCDTVAEADEVWAKLSENGTVLMPYQPYLFSAKYGWCSDRFGLNWQVYVKGDDDKYDQKINPCLMFTGNQHGNCEPAINFYTSLFGNSGIKGLYRYEKGEQGIEGTIKHGVFTLHGQTFVAMDSHADNQFTFNEAVSLYVKCKGQAEVDKYWEILTANGGQEAPCGWLKDKYGVSWQIIPDELIELTTSKDRIKADRAFAAMLKMKKIVIKDLEG